MQYQGSILCWQLIPEVHSLLAAILQCMEHIQADLEEDGDDLLNTEIVLSKYFTDCIRRMQSVFHGR